jgi:hypothetical protein
VRIDDVARPARLSEPPEQLGDLLRVSKDGCRPWQSCRTISVCFERMGRWMRKYVVDVDDDDERVTRDVERRLLEEKAGCLSLRKDGSAVYIVVCVSLQVSSFMAGALRQC